MIGFIFEPIGPITNPLYSVQLYPEFVTSLHAQEGFSSMRESLHTEKVFLVKRTLKVINNKLDEMLSKKGCDASNMFDEEIPAEEQEFSDDDLEKEHKKSKK